MGKFIVSSNLSARRSRLRQRASTRRLFESLGSESYDYNSLASRLYMYVWTLHTLAVVARVSQSMHVAWADILKNLFYYKLYYLCELFNSSENGNVHVNSDD